MKNSVLQFTKQYVNDSKKYIIGNVAEHLLSITKSNPDGYFIFLTEDEINDYENSPINHKSLIENEIDTFITNHFNFDIKDFIY